MEEQNQNSITPLVSGSLAKANGSIGITNKILSESIHEFHGDFEGKKIWEIQSGLNTTIGPKLGFTALIIFDNILFFYNKSLGFKLFNKNTGNLISEKSEKWNFISITKSKQSNIFFFTITGLGYMRNNIPIKGYLCYLSKYSVPDLKLIKSEMLFDDSFGEENDYAVDLQVTPDNKYVVTTLIYKPENKMTITFWNYNTLERLKSLEIEDVKTIKEKSTDYKQFLGDCVSAKNEIIFIEGTSLFVIVMRNKKISYCKFSSKKTAMFFNSDWTLCFYDYSNSNIKLSCEVIRIRGHSGSFRDEEILQIHKELVEKEMNVEEWNKCFNQWDEFFNSSWLLVQYSAKLKFLVAIEKDWSETVNLYEVKTDKKVRTFKPSKELFSKKGFMFSNSGNYLMAYNTGNIDIYESKNFDLLANYDRSEGRKYEYAEIDIDGEIGTTVGWEHNYKTAIFDTDDKYIYTLCTDGSIHKWK